ncbi:MAG: hypothetical protein ABEI98_06080 [Halorhabdus sp.]
MSSATDAWQRIRPGAVSGAVAWILGVAIALALWALFASSEGIVASLASSIVFYYTFHLWPALPLLTAPTSIFVVFTPVAVLLLFWAGFRTAMRTGAASGRAGFTHGATVVVGYLTLALASLPAFGFSVGTSPLADPLVAAIVVGITGVAFPIVFGGLGGWLAGR